jgi:phage shock protein A
MNGEKQLKELASKVSQLQKQADWLEKNEMLLPSQINQINSKSSVGIPAYSEIHSHIHTAQG